MLCHVFWSQVEYKIICFISSLFPGIKINENSLQQSGYSTRTLFPPPERYENPTNTSRSIIHPSRVPMSSMAPSSGVSMSPMAPQSGVPNMSPMVNEYNQKATGSYIVPNHSYARAAAHGSNGLNKQPPYAYNKDLMSEMIKQLTLNTEQFNKLFNGLPYINATSVNKLVMTFFNHHYIVSPWVPLFSQKNLGLCSIV